VFRAVALGGKVSAGPLADDSASWMVKGYAIEGRSRFPLPMPGIAYRPNSDIRRRRPMPVSETNSIALLSVGPAASRPWRSFRGTSPTLECGHSLKRGGSCSDVCCGWRAAVQVRCVDGKDVRELATCARLLVDCLGVRRMLSQHMFDAAAFGLPPNTIPWRLVVS
jgi:hypothetical protein